LTRPRRTTSRVRRRSRIAVLALVLAVAALVMPDASVRPTPAMLVKVDTAAGVDHGKDILWILALGSDARPGEAPLHTRADAIQLVGLNYKTGTAADVGIPRDSWVDIPGHGFNRINAALFYGGPQLMADTVANLVGVHADYVFVTTFTGFKALVQSIGGVTVWSPYAFHDDNMAGSIRQGWNKLNGFQALFFGRARHLLPRGDFDRSAHQQELLRAILRKVRAQQAQPGFIERGVLSATRHLYTDLSPVELYRLAQAATQIDPTRFKGCVVNGTIGDVNGASIVFPDTAQARRIGDDIRPDARLDNGC
jgi:LCP family protein required for cell wall assembly